MPREKIEVNNGRANISLIITCKDLEQYLKETIQSIKQQTVMPGEVIVVHDGCEKPQMWDETQTLFRQNNVGVVESRDQGVRLSKFPFILFIDADDVLPETFIQKLTDAMTDNVDITYPDVLLWVRWGDGTKQNVFYEVPDKIELSNMLKNNWVVVSSLMRRKVYEDVGGFENLPVLEDWVFWLSALKKKYKFKKAHTYLKYRQRTLGRNKAALEKHKEIHELVKRRFNVK